VLQSELVVDEEYAYSTFDPFDGPPAAARVRLLSVDGGEKATVVVLDPGPPLPPHSWQLQLRGQETRQVATRLLACPWAQWPERAAAAAAAKEKEKAEQAATLQRDREEDERGQVDRVRPDRTRPLPESHDEADRDWTRPDPTRPLPESYDEAHRSVYSDEQDERAAMVAAFVAALRLPGAADEIAPLVADLPAPVARDVLAALRAGVSAGPGSVGAVFARAARLIDNAWTAAWKQIGTASPSPLPQLLGERDAAFVTAVCEQVAAAGGEIVLPPVPALPSWLDDEVLERSAAFGWLRAAIGDTDGVLLHDPGCRVIRSRPLSQVDHVPLWRVLIERPDRLCSVCGGPALRDLVPLAGFVAAVDVWHVRGCGPVERWQQVALQRLVATSAEARARLAEPEVTLAARIVGALAADAPGEEGRAAYSLAVPILDWLVELTPAQREDARVLTRDRLTVLEQQLPADQRAVSLPADVDADTVRDRYRQLTSRFAGIPQLDRLLFGLPGPS